MQILVVEDEPGMATLLKRTLQEDGHQVVLANDGKQGFEIARCSVFDVIVLDVMLPGMDGVSVARKLRECRDQTPVLMLTARDSPGDVVTGLDSGADDYLTKPFSLDVLLARLRAVSRRGAIPRPVCLEVADVKLDPASHRVSRAGETLPLTPREYALLELLMRNSGQVLTRELIFDRVWGYDFGANSNSLEVYIGYLRRKTEAEGEARLIHTVRGVGYVLRESPSGA